MTDTQVNTAVPTALRTWFVIHFVTDLVFAFPLMLAPVKMLSLFGWQTVDPYTVRMAAAALFGIGIQSYLERHAGAEAFRSLLNQKIIWSSAVVVGLVLSLAERAQGNPPFAWLVLLIFVGFNLLWVYWRKELDRAAS